MRLAHLLTALSLALMPAFLSTAAMAQDHTVTGVPAGPALPDSHDTGSQFAENAALKFDKTLVEFGTREEGERVEIIYNVTNSSEKVVNISQIRPSCGCTAATGNPDKIEPGQTVPIKLILDTRNRLGEQYKAATVITDDPNQQNYQIAFRGTVITDLQFSEPALNFGEVEQGKETTKEVVLVSRGEKPVSVKDVTTTDDKISAKLIAQRASATKPGETEFVFAVTIPAESPQGNVFSAITVNTDHATKTQLTLPVRATIIGEVSYAPAQLVGYVPEGGTLDRFVVLTARASETLEVVSAKAAEGAPIEVTVEDMPRPNMKKLKATMSAPAERNLNTTIDVTVKLASGKEVSMGIPTMVIVRPTQANVQRSEPPRMRPAGPALAPAAPGNAVAPAVAPAQN